MRLFLPFVIALLALVPSVMVSAQQQKKEALVDQVKKAIDKGIVFLRNAGPNGIWEDTKAGFEHKGGSTALVLLALLNAGEPVNSPIIQKGLTYLRKLDSPTTYSRALQTMAYAEAGLDEDRQRIQRNVDHLIAKRIGGRGQPLEGWSYEFGGGLNIGRADSSNTQYAVLALYYGRQAGARIDRVIWEEIRAFYQKTQNQDGGWSYAAEDKVGSSLTMTAAGLCGLLIAGQELNIPCVDLKNGDPVRACGDYKDNSAAESALNWISGPRVDRFQFHLPPRTFYNLYGIERAGRLSGMRFFGEHDWYREGCEWLVQRQRNDGSWKEDSAWDSWPNISTSFALLFLSKGRTPVLISKLAHGPVPRHLNDLDWNNDRNDLRHLTDFASKELFKKLPLAWQNFDMLRAAQNANTDDELLDVAADMLQSPIVYFNGHQSPVGRFKPKEIDLLQKYVENGGFILVEACCASPKFDAGFRKLVRDLFNDTKLELLPGDHPVYSAYMPVNPKEFPLWGIQSGCKTVLVYSPGDLSCMWESNRLDNDKVKMAFRLGTNIIAYATGREPPRPRLDRVELAIAKNELREIERGFLKVGQLKHNGEWQPAPKAMGNLLTHLRKLAGMDVDVRTEGLTLNERALIDFKFLYMHGRKEFTTKGEDLSNLRFNLENGGLLLADACCGSAAFDKSFREFIAEVLPKHKDKLERIPPSDELFSKELNGEALTAGNIRLRLERGRDMAASPPQLEGIKIKGRWAVIYSKYDLGCALERHQSADCLGYNHESALRVAGAAVLYSLRP